MLKALGEGSSAEVFHAVDLRDGREVAIKLFPRNRLSEAEFRREAAIAMRNTHENLIRLVDAGVQEGRPWLALEYVEGINGRAVLFRTDRRVDEMLHLMAQVFAGLDALHRAGLVHGDIKPENVLLRGDHVQLADFGRARLAHVLTDGRGHAGTPAYMHPSLFQRGGPTVATDCFAAWMMAWELLTGVRPYSRAELESGQPLAPPPPLPSPELDRLLRAGLSGALADARGSWLAIQLFRNGQPELPRPRPTPPPLPPTSIRPLQQAVQEASSCALIGHPDLCRPALEQLDRQWRRGGGSTLWLRTGWRPEQPLGDALSLAAGLAEALDGGALAEVARALGPLGSVLASAVPGTRSWLAAGLPRMDRPEPERLGLSLLRMLDACPPPLLILGLGFERMDGASRRLLREALAGGGLHLAVACAPGTAHGLAAELEADPLPDELPPEVEAGLSRESRHLLHCARVLELPVGPRLARAVDLPGEELERLALHLEARGVLRWTGAELLARPGPLPGPEARRDILRRAAHRLDARAEPWLVARYAMAAADPERLAEVIDEAIEVASRHDPVAALELCRSDPRPADAERRNRHFRLALLARDPAEADRALAALRALPSLGEAALAEAEAELFFRRGQTLQAITAYERAAQALGRPVPRGLRGLVGDLRGLVQVLRCRLPAPAPDPRLARVFEALYDLRFSHDHGWLLRLHRLWLQAAPEAARPLAVEVLWRQLLGRKQQAQELQDQLSRRIREEEDPVGAAVLLMHRAMSRLLRGETPAAFSDGVDAATALLRAGDPYHAALAATLPATCAIHVAGPGVLQRIHEDLGRLVALTGDERAGRWAEGTSGVLLWQQGDREGALRQAGRWAEQAQRREDPSEALARRFMAELHLEAQAPEAALRELERAEQVARRLHVRMDYIAARCIPWLIAEGLLRRGGSRPPAGRRRQLRAMAALVRTSPRWEPRALVARAMQALGDGQLDRAQALLAASVRGALDRGQPVDAWWALHLRALYLGDDEARATAAALARTHHLHAGPPRSDDA